jgi:hypothetical protein
VSEDANKRLDEQIVHIQNAHDLAEFIKTLRQDFEQHPDRWENQDLSRYLEAMAAWLEDSEGRAMGISSGETWRAIAVLLLSSSLYE